MPARKIRSNSWSEGVATSPYKAARNTAAPVAISPSVATTGRTRVTDLRLFGPDTDGQDVELRGSTVALEVELQRRVEAGLESMLGIRFLASEYPTGPWHRGRIDTLGLDENGSPVVIEYKKGSDSGVLSQAVSYLSWLDSAHHEFEALVRKVLGSEAAETIDWRRPRMICIAAGFSHHDRVAVQRLPQRVDLVRYRVFEGDLLSLLLVDSSPGLANAAASRRTRERGTAATSVPAAPATSAPTGPGLVPECLRDLYAELDDALTAWGEVEVAPLRHYIAYCRLVNVASVIFRPKHEVILVYLRLDPDTIPLEGGFTRDVRGIGHLGTGDLEVRLASTADLEKAAPLIRRAFEAA
jgi:predicted transport protein